ncbi:hypothetical protein LIA77_07480 [Sarocladium implicatum]|nr:hypothetical protein LIA77_07480 [Sarocladium implicatum]
MNREREKLRLEAAEVKTRVARQEEMGQHCRSDWGQVAAVGHQLQHHPGGSVKAQRPGEHSATQVLKEILHHSQFNRQLAGSIGQRSLVKSCNHLTWLLLELSDRSTNDVGEDRFSEQVEYHFCIHASLGAARLSKTADFGKLYTCSRSTIRNPDAPPSLH